MKSWTLGKTCDGFWKISLGMIFGISFLQIFGHTKDVDRSAFVSSSDAIVSGVTGNLPCLSRTRRYKDVRKFVNFSLENDHKLNYGNKTDKWGVCTTISEISDAIRRVAEIEGWYVVVVGDVRTPQPESLHPNIVFLSMEDQRRFNDKIGTFIKNIPENHFGRKNIGYLYAIYHGAKEIFDFDDDNFLKKGNNLTPLDLNIVEMRSDNNCLAVNPYPMMGAPSVGKVPAWPRGYPLEKIKANCSEKLYPWKLKKNLDILQYLADKDPDVDAIFRLTREIPFSFNKDSRRLVAIRPGLYAPFNAQATFFRYPSFWSLYLPVTVHGRVSDIWRSFIAQRILWEHGGQLGFLPPGVDQIRNTHNFLADMDAEKDLYEKSFRLIEILDAWVPSVKHIPGMLEELYIHLYEYKIVEITDIVLVQEWLFALNTATYEFTV